MHFSYKNFYFIYILNLIYSFSIYLSLFYFIKFYNYLVNFIIIAITINYLDQPFTII